MLALRLWSVVEEPVGHTWAHGQQCKRDCSPRPERLHESRSRAHDGRTEASGYATTPLDRFVLYLVTTAFVGGCSSGGGTP